MFGLEGRWKWGRHDPADNIKWGSNLLKILYRKTNTAYYWFFFKENAFYDQMRAAAIHFITYFRPAVILFICGNHQLTRAIFDMRKFEK